MVGMAMVALVVVALAVTSDLGLKNKTLGFATIVVMVRHNGMQHDNCTCQRDHCLLHQMFHIKTVASLIMLLQHISLTLQRYTKNLNYT